jgi:hypothetical protein
MVTPIPWYRKTWFIVLALILLFPLGLYLLWTRQPSWGARTNWIVTGVVAVGVGLSAIAVAAAPPSTSTTPPVVGVVAPTSHPTTLPTSAATHPPTVAPTVAPTAVPTARPTARPTPRPTPRPTNPPNTCGAPANPWGYNFCVGGLIYSPPSDFCSYFNCIPSFWTSTKGYVDECNDGTYSHSGGRSGACSYHGGERRPLYS